jgi:DNA anti-recombination protein RmuC
LAPIIVRVDGIANMAVDVVESRYPYPFKAKPEEVAALARQGQENVNKAIDEKVRTPALNVAQDIDHRFSPVVDYFEIAVCRLNGSKSVSPTASDSKYQYQRALALSKTLGDNFYVYSNDQLKHLQAQSVMVQKASDTAQSIRAATSSTLTSAHSRVSSLSDTMLAELNKLQNSAASFKDSLQTNLQSSASQIQSQIPQIHQSYTDLSAALSSAANELGSIITNQELPLQERLGRVGTEVRERIQPLLDSMKNGVSKVLARSKSQVDSPGNGDKGRGG